MRIKTLAFALATLAVFVFVRSSCCCCHHDSTIPEVTSCNPTNGQTGVSLDTDVTVTFSQDMDKSSVEYSFYIDPPVSGDFSWPQDDRVVFTPDQPLDPNTTYTITVNCGAQSAEGVPLDDMFETSFTTGSS